MKKKKKEKDKNTKGITERGRRRKKMGEEVKGEEREREKGAKLAREKLQHKQPRYCQQSVETRSM